MSRKDLLILAAIIFLHVIILLSIVFWPAQEFRTFPYLTSKGLIPYKQIIDQHFPGLFFFPLNLFTLGLANYSGLRLIQIILIICSQIMIFLIMKQLIKSKKYIFTANLLYTSVHILYEGYVLWIDSFIPPLLLISFYLLIYKGYKHINLRYFFSGLILALAVLFKQTVILVFLIVLIHLLFKKKFKHLALYFLIGFLVPVLYLFYFLYKNNIYTDFFYWTISFNRSIYPALAFRDPSVKELIFLLILLIPALISSLTNLFINKMEHFKLITCYLLTSLIFIYGRYDFVHFQPFIPFAVIAAVNTIKDNYYKQMVINFVLFIVFTSLLINRLPKLNDLHKNVEKTHQKSIQELNMLKNDKSIYIHNSYPELYQILNITPPNNFFAYNHPWYMEMIENQLLKSLKNSQPDVIIINRNEGESEIKSFIENRYKINNTYDDLHFYYLKK